MARSDGNDDLARVLLCAEVAERRSNLAEDGTGIAKGTFYLYFDSKEQLVAALQARYQESLITRAGAILDGPGTHLQRLDQFVAATVDFHRAQIHLHHALFHDTGMRDDQSTQRLTALLTTFITGGAATGVFRVGDPEFAAAFVIHGLHGALPPFPHNRTASRAGFLAAATATTRQALGAA